MANDTNENLKNFLKEQGKIEKDKLKKMTFREKIDYIWTYYKAHIIITASILFVVISFAHHLITDNQESILYSMILNGTSVSIETSMPTLYTDFMEEQGFDPKDYKVDYHSGLYVTLDEYGEARDLQMFSAVATILMTATVDHILTDEDVLVMLAEIGYIMPVENYLPAEKMDEYDKEGKLIYALHPETNEMAAFGISLAESQRIQESGLLADSPVYAMIHRAPHQENSVEFLYFLNP